jgi:hypothetical protein
LNIDINVNVKSRGCAAPLRKERSGRSSELPDGCPTANGGSLPPMTARRSAVPPWRHSKLRDAFNVSQERRSRQAAVRVLVGVRLAGLCGRRPCYGLVQRIEIAVDRIAVVGEESDLLGHAVAFFGQDLSELRVGVLHDDDLRFP